MRADNPILIVAHATFLNFPCKNNLFGDAIGTQNRPLVDAIFSGAKNETLIVDPHCRR